MSDEHFPLFLKHIGHEEVAAAGDCVIQAVLLTGIEHLISREEY